MKKLAIFGAALILAALCNLAVAAQEKTEEKKKTSLVATWEINISAPGMDLPGNFIFEKDGDNYKGSVTTSMGDVPLKNIKVTDDTFTAEITANVQGQTMEGTMTGKVVDGKISGEINLNGLGAIPYTGKKAEKK